MLYEAGEMLLPSNDSVPHNKVPCNLRFTTKEKNCPQTYLGKVAVMKKRALSLMRKIEIAQ